MNKYLATGQYFTKISLPILFALLTISSCQEMHCQSLDSICENELLLVRGYCRDPKSNSLIIPESIEDLISSYCNIFKYIKHSHSINIESTIVDICFDSSNNRLYSAHEDQEIRIWAMGGVDKLKCIKKFKANKGSFRIKSICFNTKDNDLYCAISDGSIRIWNLNDLSNEFLYKTYKHDKEDDIEGNIQMVKSISYNSEKDGVLVLLENNYVKLLKKGRKFNSDFLTHADDLSFNVYYDFEKKIILSIGSNGYVNVGRHSIAPTLLRRPRSSDICYDSKNKILFFKEKITKYQYQVKIFDIFDIKKFKSFNLNGFNVEKMCYDPEREVLFFSGEDINKKKKIEIWHKEIKINKIDQAAKESSASLFKSGLPKSYKKMGGILLLLLGVCTVFFFYFIKKESPKKKKKKRRKLKKPFSTICAKWISTLPKQIIDH